MNTEGARPEVHQDYFEGRCYDCGRERQIRTRIEHAAKVLCDDCAAKPHKPPTATGLDADAPARCRQCHGEISSDYAFSSASAADNTLCSDCAAIPDTRLVAGHDFIIGQADTVPALWGEGDRVLWAKGEALWIAAPAGLGKTTLAGQIVLHRLGLRTGSLLDFPIEPDERRVLYIAADRPRQIARSFRRMIDDSDAAALQGGLIVHHGPLPFVLDQKPERLAELVAKEGIGTVVIDSLKDVCSSLVTDEAGIAINRALQLVVAAGVEVLVLHHQRKAQADNRKPRSLSDVYGSAWLTAGAGSVVLLWGDPGDLIVELTHLKQPLEDVGPLTIQHDHDTGTTTLQGAVDLLEVACGPNGTNARDAAALVYGKPNPERNEIEKVRRRLEQLRKRGDLDKFDPPAPGEPCTYFAVREPREGSVTPLREGSRDPHAPAHTGSRTLTQPSSPPCKGDEGQPVSLPTGAAA